MIEKRWSTSALIIIQIRHRLLVNNRGIRRGVETFRGRVKAWDFLNVA
ncbi:MAG: hypothetical protein ACXW6J_08060 [Candidatus Binatia bacterium]